MASSSVRRDDVVSYLAPLAAAAAAIGSVSRYIHAVIFALSRGCGARPRLLCDSALLFSSYTPFFVIYGIARSIALMNIDEGLRNIIRRL